MFSKYLYTGAGTRSHRSVWTEGRCLAPCHRSPLRSQMETEAGAGRVFDFTDFVRSKGSGIFFDADLVAEGSVRGFAGGRGYPPPGGGGRAPST